MPTSNPSAVLQVTSGSYTGDDTADRAIPHGLPTTPKAVFIVDAGNAGIRFLLMPAQLNYVINSAANGYTVTTWDTTNFYVGEAGSYGQSANANTVVYYWCAVG